MLATLKSEIRLQLSPIIDRIGWTGGAFCLATVLLAHVWLTLAIIHRFHGSIFLLICVVLFWVYILNHFFGKYIPEDPLRPIETLFSRFPWLTPICYVLSLSAITAYVLSQSIHNGPRMSSFGTLVLIVVVAVFLSDNPARIRWRPVVWGIILQYIVALLILKWNAGKNSMQFLTEQIVFFLGYTSAGTNFVFGYIPSPPNICGMDGPFSFTSLPIIIFFSALCGAAYYVGLVQWILRKLAMILQWTMGTTSAESLNAMASVFLGPTEGAVLMQFSLSTMTYSEIVASNAVGFSMISGSLFALYIAFGACPTILLSANVMSAPAVLAISKIMCPEVQKSKQKDMKSFVFPPTTDTSVLGAISRGATNAVPVIFAIIANLIVFLALIQFVDYSIQYAASCVGYEDVTFNKLMGYAFFPLAYIMGASEESVWEKKRDETLKVAQLIGTKTVLNEFIAYQQMQGMLLRGDIGPRAQMIAIYALCGYSNVSQIGSQLGIFIAMCPQKKKQFVTSATKGLIIGSLACFMTACVAGSIISDNLGCMPPDPSASCLDVSKGFL